MRQPHAKSIAARKCGLARVSVVPTISEVCVPLARVALAALPLPPPAVLTHVVVTTCCSGGRYSSTSSAAQHAKKRTRRGSTSRPRRSATRSRVERERSAAM